MLLSTNNSPQLSRGHKGSVRRKPVEGRPGYYHCRGVVCNGAPRHTNSFKFGKPRGGKVADYETCHRCYKVRCSESGARHWRRHLAKNRARHLEKYKPAAWGSRFEHRGLVDIQLVRPLLLEIRQYLKVAEIAERVQVSKGQIYKWSKPGNKRAVNNIQKQFAVDIVKLCFEVRENPPRAKRAHKACFSQTHRKNSGDAQISLR